jgi:hypothetical protein
MWIENFQPGSRPWHYTSRRRSECGGMTDIILRFTIGDAWPSRVHDEILRGSQIAWLSAGCVSRFLDILLTAETLVVNIPKGFHAPAQGCDEGATLGKLVKKTSTLKELRRIHSHEAATPSALFKILGFHPG